MKKIYGSLSEELTDREIRNMELARRAARESFVLLKNDGVLPIAPPKKIALFGMGGRKTIKGGTGSGSVQERHSVNIEEGLENAGYTITTKKYLDDYDLTYEAAYKQWHDAIDEKTLGMPMLEALGMVSIVGEFQWPAGRKVTKEDVEVSDTDTAIYVLARQAGEGSDRKLEKGDWYLSDAEVENLRLVAREYKNTIVIINIGGQIDLSFMDDIEGINALVFIAQGGMEGGNALADVLSGKYSFSGKLADTWAKKYEDIPFAMEYSYLNNNLVDEYYREGIYVGYRYFDTFSVEPRYPFGYGLSYTSFSWEVGNITAVGSKVSVSVAVTNTGKSFAGKEVLQGYLSYPKGKTVREYQSLVAFTKTKELTPGETQEVQLAFDISEAAYYSEEESSWELDAGDYMLWIGTSSKDTRSAAVLEIPAEIKTIQCKNCCVPKQPIEEIEAAVETRTIDKLSDVISDVTRVVIQAEDISLETCDYTLKAEEETKEEKRILDSLNIEEMISLLRGGDLQKRSPHIHGALGTTGRTSLDLRKHGIGNIVFSDGPAGINIMEHVRVDENGMEKPTQIPEKYNFGSFAQMAQSMIATEGTHIYRYATAWPVELLLAQSWDTELLEEVGRGMGAELEEFGIALLLAPGMNIHRNPLCGRNFEYFSEDPYLTGKLAAAQIRGTQSYPGVGLTVKHFCCNNQENNRIRVSSNVNERALREIYLKGFEIAVKEAQPLALMSSYNRLNGIYTPNNYELLTDILRMEWHYQGLVMTDWNSCTPGQGDPAKCAPAGNDLIMPGTDADQEAITKAVEDGKITREELRRSAKRVLRLILQCRI